MSDAAAPKAPKAKKAPAKKAEHPGFIAMIVEAIAALKEVSIPLAPALATKCAALSALYASSTAYIRFSTQYL
jgi:hypothetical protein